MKRIKPNRCGYISGYICKPIKSLHPVFKETHTNTYATIPIEGSGTSFFNSDWVGPADVSSDFLLGTIDNYAQLPQHFAGFIMTLAPIIDMSGGSNNIEVPELECRVDFNPFAAGDLAVLNSGIQYTYNPETANTGFLDFYNQVEDYSSSVYVDVEGTTASYVLSTEMPVYLQGSTIAHDHTIGYEIIGETITQLAAGPGILEPMLDTSLPPVAIDTIPSADIIGDFAMWEFNTLGQWQRLVDTRINNLKAITPAVDYSKINGLLNLTDEKNWHSPCSNFNISIVNGDHALIDSAVYNIPSFQVSDGAVVIKDDNRSDWDTQTVSCSGINSIAATTDVTQALDFYLDISWDTWPDPDSKEGAQISGYKGAVISVIPPFALTREPGHTYVYVGRIKYSYNGSNDEFGEGSTFLLFEPEQAECIDYLDLTSGPVVSADYRGPFKLKLSEPAVYVSSGATFSSTGVVGFPSSGTATSDLRAYTLTIEDGANSIPCDNGTDCFAGYVIEGGTITDKSRIPTATITLAEGATVITYLKGTKTDSTWTWDYDPQIGKRLPSADSNSYMVPLGIVDGGKVSQIQYGHVFMDLQNITSPSSSSITEYHGPFHLKDELDFECIEGTGANCIIGDLVWNGYQRKPVTSQAVVVSPGTATAIYAHVTANTVTFDTNSDPGKNPPTYTVRIASISGATTTPKVVSGSTVYELSGDNIHVTQYHYGDIHVDGRWM